MLKEINNIKKSAIGLLKPHELRCLGEKEGARWAPFLIQNGAI
jgi:hypothetical protein